MSTPGNFADRAEAMSAPGNVDDVMSAS